MIETAAPPFARVERLWPGETVVIIGGGSSLTPDDVDYVRGKARVIAIKESYLLAPWADVLYACDPKWWAQYKGATTFTGMKYALEPVAEALKTAPHTNIWPNVHILRNTGHQGIELEDRSGLRTGFNSGYQALNLAVHFGAARIILLAFDMWFGADNNPNWYPDHPAHTPSTAKSFALFMERFGEIAPVLHGLGIEVLNASRFTVMSCFPRVPLEAVL